MSKVMTSTQKYILAECTKALNTSDKAIADKAMKNITMAIKLNVDDLPHEELKAIEFEVQKKLGIIKERPYVINIKFGSESVGDIRFTAYTKEEGKEMAKSIGVILENLYRSFTEPQEGEIAQTPYDNTIEESKEV